jgi:hypothetical protein
MTTANFSNVENLQVANVHNAPLTIELNQLINMAFSANADNITLHLNQSQATPITIKTGAGADVVHLTPSRLMIDNSFDPPTTTILASRDYLNFADLMAQDKIDLSAFGITSKTQIVNNWATLAGRADGYYLVHNVQISPDWEVTRLLSEVPTTKNQLNWHNNSG